MGMDISWGRVTLVGAGPGDAELLTLKAARVLAQARLVLYDNLVSPEVMAYIVDQCKDPDSGGRMVDNIITNTILPDLSREVLSRMVAQTEMKTVEVVMKDGKIGYDFA